MNYNILVIISLIITATISYVFGTFLTDLLIDESSSLYSIVQLFIVIILLSSFYATIKYLLSKYMS